MRYNQRCIDFADFYSLRFVYSVSKCRKSIQTFQVLQFYNSSNKNKLSQENKHAKLSVEVLIPSAVH